jgi:hypothetical protein
MAYCPRCGVEVEDRLEQCPLCDTRIPDEVREHPDQAMDYPEDVIPANPMYKTLSAGQKRSLAALLIGFLAFFPVILTAGLDFAGSGGISWSYFVIVPVFGAAAVAWLSFRLFRRPFLLVTGIILVLLAVQILIELRVAGAGFLSSPVLPFSFVVFVCVEAALFYSTRRRRSVLQLLSVILFIAVVLNGAIDFLVSGSLSWSLVVASAVLPVVLYFIYLRRVRDKGLNLAGFFFIDLTLLMLCLDLSISGRIGWSAVTGLIFLTIAVLFYVLHVVLFNDIDWKKALHL